MSSPLEVSDGKEKQPTGRVGPPADFDKLLESPSTQRNQAEETLQYFLKKLPPDANYKSLETALFDNAVHASRRLLAERDDLERQLSPQRSLDLATKRLATAQANEANKQRNFIAIDTEFPEIGAKNREIEASLVKAFQIDYWSSGSREDRDTTTFSGRKTANDWFIRKESTINCHSPRNSFETSNYSWLARPSARDYEIACVRNPKLYELHQNYAKGYSQFEGAATAAARYGTKVYLELVDQKPKPYFALTLNNREARLPINTDKDIETELAKLAAAKSAEIEKTYGLTIVSPEKPASPAAAPNTDGSKNASEMEKLGVRAPRISELYGIEEACKVSQTTLALRKSDDKPLRLACVTNQSEANGKSAGEYWVTMDGLPTVTLYDKHGDKATGDAEDALHSSLTVKEIMVHELSHRHQDIMNWNQMNCPTDIGEGMGWKQLDSWKSGWILRCENDQYYRLGDRLSQTWYRCSQDGKPVGSAGTVVDDVSKAVLKSSREVRELALIKPASNYFTNPTEMFAEALTALRGSRAWRANLIAESPELYDIAKRQDNLELELYCKKQEPGKTKIRTADGAVVDSTPDELEKLALFEYDSARQVASRELATKLGWKQVGSKDDGWILKCGTEYYRPDAETRYGWLRCDQNGTPVDATGRKVIKALADQPSDQTVKLMAEVAIATSAFNSPSAMLNEALTTFKQGGNGRQKLLENCPELYEEAKRIDQQMIDSLSKRYHSGMERVRALDGSIVEKTESVAKAIKTFEEDTFTPLIPKNELKKVDSQLEKGLPNITHLIHGENTPMGEAQEKALLEANATFDKYFPDRSLIEGRREKILAKETTDRTQQALMNLELLETRIASTKAALAAVSATRGDLDGVRNYVKQASQGGYVPTLQLSDVTVDDDCLKEFAPFKSLNALNLKDASITDAGMETVSQFRELKALSLGSENIKGPGLELLKENTKLERLILSSSAYNDEVLRHLPPMPNLLHLDLSQTKVTDEFLARIGDFPNLQTLALPPTAGGKKINELNKLQNLGVLHLSGKSIDDAALQSINGNSKTQYLSLTDIAISDEGLAHIAKFPQLRAIALEGGQLTDAGLKHLTNLTRLAWIQLPKSTTAAGIETLGRTGNSYQIAISGDTISDSALAALQKRYPKMYLYRKP